MLLAQSSSTRKNMDKEVDNFFGSKKVPGLVVMYSKNGKTTYERTRGEADMGKDIKIKSHHIMRHASVDKLIAATLALKLEEKGKLNVNKKVREYLPQLPAHHNYRVVDLIRCRSGVRHYGEPTSSQSPKNWGNKQYDWAYTAAKNFWHDPKAGTTGDYHYSSHGYTILAAIMEKVTGKPIAKIVKDELSNPYQLYSLAAEDKSKYKAMRVRLYEYDSSQKDKLAPVGRDNISWKVLGGGMESSSKDLLRFLILLGDGKIISKSNLNRMMQRAEADQSYAMGCNVGIVNGYHFLAKSGGQTGASTYVWLVPKARAAMVVMINRKTRDNESLASSLGKKLRNIVMNSSAEGNDPDLIISQFERTGKVYYQDGKIKIPVRLRITNQGKGPTFKKQANGFAQDKFVNAIRIGKKYYWTSFQGSMSGRQQTGWIKATVSIPDKNKLYAGRTFKLEAMADAPVAAADTSVNQTIARIKESNDKNNSKFLSVKIPGGKVEGFAGQKPSTGQNAPTKKPSWNSTRKKTTTKKSGYKPVIRRYRQKSTVKK